MIEIKRHGSYLEIDEDGFVIPTVSNELVQESWQPIIEKTIEFYQNIFHKNLHSVYIRGSVAKGEAVDDISDLDSFTVLKNEDTEIDSKALDNFETQIQKDFPFCQHIEISAITLNEISKDFPPRKRSVWEELIKTQSICVYGENLANTISPFKLKDMIGHSLYIEKELNKLNEYFEEDKGDPKALAETCVWISRRVIRSGFDLVMLDEKKFTRDLYLCYEVFVKYYPEKESEMYAVLKLSLNPISDVAKINEILDQICPWLVSEINEKIF